MHELSRLPSGQRSGRGPVSARRPLAGHGACTALQCLAASFVLLLNACSVGGPALSSAGTGGDAACDGGRTPAAALLSLGDVQPIIAREVAMGHGRGAGP